MTTPYIERYLVAAKRNLDRSMTLFNTGFTTKQQQKQCMSYITRAYESYKSCITGLMLEIPNEDQTEEQNRVYWLIPSSPHYFKKNHFDAVLAAFPAAEPYLMEMQKLADLRVKVKTQAVVKLEKQGKVMQEKTAKVHESIIERMERLGVQYEKALSLLDLFGGLDVHANVHVVVNQYGTRYLRSFYYLNGKLTPLQLIIAAYETHARKNKVE